MIVEMRTYKTKPGLRTRFLEMFRTKSVPAHDEIGMKILGPFLSLEGSRHILLHARLSRPRLARAHESKVL